MSDNWATKKSYRLNFRINPTRALVRILKVGGRLRPVILLGRINQFFTIICWKVEGRLAPSNVGPGLNTWTFTMYVYVSKYYDISTYVHIYNCSLKLWWRFAWNKSSKFLHEKWSCTFLTLWFPLALFVGYRFGFGLIREKIGLIFLTNSYRVFHMDSCEYIRVLWLCFLSQTLFPSFLCWKCVYILIFGIKIFFEFFKRSPLWFGVFFIF